MKFTVRIVAIDKCNGARVRVRDSLDKVVNASRKDDIRIDRGGIHYSRQKLDLDQFDLEIEKDDA